MSSTSTFISSSNQKRWILEIDNYISKVHVVNINSEYPTCVFRVPKSLSETKPEAYVPQRIGLGPYHHLRPEFYDMQKHKISAIKRFLGTEKLPVINQVVTALIKSESVVRACYDQYLDFHIETLARVLAIDILYLLQLFTARKNDRVLSEERVSCEIDFSVNTFPEEAVEDINDQVLSKEGFSCDIDISVKQYNFPEEAVEDIMMLENQIPIVLLKIIDGVLTSHKVCEPERGGHALSRQFQGFCEAHSPLELEEMIVSKELHLLHRMYCLIVENRGGMSQGVMSDEVDEFSEDVSTCLEILGVPVAPLRKILELSERVKRVVARFKREETPTVVQIEIPKVSEMSTAVVGIQFKCTIGGIRDIEYEVDKKVFYLPRFKPDASSETILRNMVAFEAASMKPGSARELASYVDLMCAIISVEKDVDILKKAGIIKGDRPDEAIVCLFNAMRRSRGEDYKKPLNIQKAIDSVNRRYNGVCSVKVKRFLKNVAWKTISRGVAVVVVVLLALQTLCSVFGCARWFRKSITVQGFIHFPYVDH